MTAENKKENKRQLAWINRQPTLTAASLPAIKILPNDDETSVIKVSPLFIEPLNMDFDGD